MKHRKIQQNISLAIELVQDCQYLLALISKVNDYIKDREFYPALKVKLFGFIIAN